MKLTELDARFVTDVLHDGYWGIGKCSTFEQAQGILFLCPKCFNESGHSILVWFKDRNVSPSALPAPRWIATGTSLDDLTLSPSIDLGGTDWHGFIINGEIK